MFVMWMKLLQLTVDDLREKTVDYINIYCVDDVGDTFRVLKRCSRAHSKASGFQWFPPESRKVHWEQHRLSSNTCETTSQSSRLTDSAASLSEKGGDDQIVGMM